MAGNIIHYGAVELRVNGSGNLLLKLKGLDDAYQLTLVPLVMSTAPGRQQVRLGNFMNQKARLRIETNVINEIFKINKVIIWVKPVYTSYPG